MLRRGCGFLSTFGRGAKNFLFRIGCRDQCRNVTHRLASRLDFGYLSYTARTDLSRDCGLGPPMSINTQEQAHRHSRGQSDGGNSSTDILSSRVCLVGDRSNYDGCLLLFLATYYFLRQGLQLSVTFPDLSRLVVSELWGFFCLHIPPCPAGI